jgi:hypothetical protein
VTVVNPADIAKAEGIQTPFQGAGSCTFSGGACGGQINIPPSQRLVVEFVTAACNVIGDNVLSNSEITIVGSGAVIAHQLIANAPISGFGGSFGVSKISQLVRVYTDAGDGPAFLFQSSGFGANDGQECTFSVSGQLVAVP